MAVQQSTKPHSSLSPGDVFTVIYPFVRDTYEAFDGDESGCGTTMVQTWKPAVRYELHGPEGDTYTFADALGLMQLTVVSLHKPGKYPMRVFYTRRFINPDGKWFGKGKLRVTIESAFRRLTLGYFHEYELVGCAQCNEQPWHSKDHREHLHASVLAQREAQP